MGYLDPRYTRVQRSTLGFAIKRKVMRECHVYEPKTPKTFLKTFDVFLNETSTTNFFTFNGVITDYLPPAEAPAFTIHPDGHTFTICTACECFGPDLDFCEGRGEKGKPSSNHIILLLALMNHLPSQTSQPIVALTARCSNSM